MEDGAAWHPSILVISHKNYLTPLSLLSFIPVSLQVLHAELCTNTNSMLENKRNAMQKNCCFFFLYHIPFMFFNYMECGNLRAVSLIKVFQMVVHATLANRWAAKLDMPLHKTGLIQAVLLFFNAVFCFLLTT